MLLRPFFEISITHLYVTGVFHEIVEHFPLKFRPHGVGHVAELLNLSRGEKFGVVAVPVVEDPAGNHREDEFPFFRPSLT